MATVQEWRDQRAAAITEAKTIVVGAKAADRELTSTEHTVVSASMAQVAQLDGQIKGRALVDSVISLGSVEDFDPERQSIFSETAAKDLLSAVKTRSAYRTEVSTKAALGSGALVPTSGTVVSPGLFPGAYPLALLFGSEVANGPSVRYYTLGGATAAVVAEGALKPDAVLAITPKDLVLEKLATTTKFSDEFSEDAAFLLAYLGTELTNAVVTKENSEILATFSSTSGILTATSTAATVLDTVADVVASQEALNGVSPTGVIVNPATLAIIRKAKATTAGSYFIDPLAAGPAMLHGVPLISSAVTPAGTAWVVTGTGVTIYRRGPITVEIGTSDSDFMTNSRTMRVEERFGTAVTRPTMLTKVTLT